MVAFHHPDSEHVEEARRHAGDVALIALQAGIGTLDGEIGVTEERRQDAAGLDLRGRRDDVFRECPRQHVAEERFLLRLVHPEDPVRRRVAFIEGPFIVDLQGDQGERHEGAHQTREVQDHRDRVAVEQAFQVLQDHIIRF